MNPTIEKEVPSTSPWILRSALGLLIVAAPIVITALGQAVINGSVGEILLGAYATGAASLAGYLITKGLRNPDRLSINDEGFEYKFKNITFRVEWGDVEDISLKDGKVVEIRLRDTEKVAFNSLVGRRGLPSRSQFNPYNWIALKRSARFERQWPKNNDDLARFLEESGNRNGYHIAIPVFASSEEAEAIGEEMKRRQRDWRPTYSPYSLTSNESTSQLSISVDEQISSEQSSSNEPSIPRRERERQ